MRSSAELDHQAFYDSAFYNEIWRPQGLRRRVEAVVRSSRCQPLGSLVLYRGPHDAAFAKGEEVLLATLVPYIARALEVEAAMPREYVARRDRRALLSLSCDGALQHVSRDAHKMLLLAHGGITPETAGRAPEGRHYPTLTLLIDEVMRNHGRSRAAADLTVENR